MSGDPKSHGLWEQTAPPAPATRALEGSLQTDVAIVGGGYAGLSAALHLGLAGAQAVVLEGREIGFGGAGRNVGLINAGLWVMPDEIAARLGGERGERLLDLLGRGPGDVMTIIDRHGIECELERQGTLHCAVGAKGLVEIEARAAQWQRREAPVELLDAAETAARTGSARYSGALLDRRAGTLQPLAYARGLAKAAIAEGAKVFTASPVLDSRREEGRWTLSTPAGEVRASNVIVATDAYGMDRFADIREEQVRLPYFNLATAPLGDALSRSILPGREGAWDTKGILSSFRMDHAGRLVFGSVGALRNTGSTVHVGWAKREVKRLFPQIGRVEFEHGWFGQIGMTKDAMPHFHILAPGMVGFAGYNGRGIAPGTVFGRLLADFVLGRIAEGDMPLPATPLRRANLRPIREAGYELGAQLAHLPGALAWR